MIDLETKKALLVLAETLNRVVSVVHTGLYEYELYDLVHDLERAILKEEKRHE